MVEAAEDEGNGEREEIERRRENTLSNGEEQKPVVGLLGPTLLQ
jgi:hypothetical protein